MFNNFNIKMVDYTKLQLPATKFGAPFVVIVYNLSSEMVRMSNQI